MDYTRERETFVYVANLAEEAERYEEMVDAMKKVAKLNVELSIEERNLLSVGFKNVIGSRRVSWRILASIEKKEETKGDLEKARRAREYKQKIECELSGICQDVMTVLDEHVIPSASVTKSIVFYYKMKGDYYRYLAEVKSGSEREVAATESMSAYEAATGPARAELPPTDPLCLGLALNYSVYYYEILGSPNRVCQIAKQAFDEAVAELDTIINNEDTYKDTTLIMQLLCDNIALWNSDIHADRNDAQQATTESTAVSGVYDEEMHP